MTSEYVATTYSQAWIVDLATGFSAPVTVQSTHFSQAQSAQCSQVQVSTLRSEFTHCAVQSVFSLHMELIEPPVRSVTQGSVSSVTYMGFSRSIPPGRPESGVGVKNNCFPVRPPAKLKTAAGF